MKDAKKREEASIQWQPIPNNWMAANFKQLEPGDERIVYQHFSDVRVEQPDVSETKNEVIYKGRGDSKYRNEKKKMPV